MSGKQHLSLICLLGAVYVVLGTIPKYTVIMNYLSWFFAYLSVAYFRIYKADILRKRNIWLIIFIVSYIDPAISIVGGDYASSIVNMRLT